MANYDAEQEQIFDRPDAEYRIYVNCLPPELDEVAIREVFNQYGRITGIFYLHNATWAYITYNSYREAERAIRELNDRRPLYLKVTLAKEKSVIKEEELQRSPVSEGSEGRSRAKDATAEPSVSTHNDTKHQQGMGHGRTMNALCKHFASQMTMSGRSTENGLLPSSSQASNPYGIEEPTLNTNKLWTKGVITITEDGQRHVTLGRGFTRYEFPKSNPKVEKYIVNVFEKRHNGLYEYGDDKLKNEVQKCLVCSNKTNKHCEKCNTYYCSINCQRNDWPRHKRHKRHKIECQRIPLVEESVKDISLLQINKDENQTKIPLTLNKTIASNEVKLRRPNAFNAMQAESSNNTDANTNMHKKNVDITNCSTNNGINDREHLSIHDNNTNVYTTKTADQPALSTMNTKDFSRQNQLQRCNNTKEDIEKSRRNDRYSTTSNRNHYSRNHNGAIRKIIPDKEKSDNSNLRNKNYNSNRSYQKNELQIDKKPTIYNDRENGPESNSSSSSTMVDEDLNFCKDTYLSKTGFTEVQILISLDNSEYWIATLKDSDTRTNLMTKLQDVAGKSRNVQPIIDGVYAVLYEGIWHRAVVISLNPVKVHYLDFGNDEILQKDAEIRGIPRDMIKIPPLARKIRLTPAASERCKNFRYDDIIFVKLVSIDAHKTIIVDVGERSEHLFSPVKNVSNKNTAEKLVRQEDVQASNENLKASMVQIPSILNAFADLFTQKAVSELEFTGLIQIHESTQENMYSATLGLQNFKTEIEMLLTYLQDDCANAQEFAHYKPQVKELLCGEGKGTWYRGYILSSSTSSDLRIIAIDEARIVEVNKIIPCPEKYLNIYTIGVICEVSHPNKLKVGEVYKFTAIMNEQNHKQENLKIKIIKDSKLVCEAIMKSWKSMISNSDKSSVPAFSEIKSGSQICLTSYRNHYYMFARSLDEEAVEYYNTIMQRVAQCARTAPYLSEPPKNIQAVIAPFSDGNRYRALVVKMQNDKAQIVYTDFGNVDEVNIKELQVLPENLALQRSCSAKISLKDVPSDASMNTKVDLFLRKLVGNETSLKCVYEGDPLKNGVYLMTPTRESVNDEIKQLLIPTWKQKDHEDNTCYMLSHIEVASLGRVGDTVNAVVLDVGEAGTYMMAPFDIELLTHITQVMPKLLREYCEKAVYYIPRKEELCLALYENEWYRAACLDHSYTTANIFYIDYGNIAEVEHKNIRLMPKDFITPAAMANLCTVVNLAPLDDAGNYSPVIRQKLAELVQTESIVKIKIVKSPESGDYEIELVDIKKTLIEEGLIPSS